MKQLVLHPNSGAVDVVDVSAPARKPGTVIVETSASLVSSGTERMILDFSDKSLLEKARARPDLVKKVLDKVKREGLLSAYDGVRARLEEPVTPGYSCVGRVVDVGDGVRDLSVGDLVACAGAGHAVHAEVVRVPQNLACRVPERVEPECAAFTTVGAIALHGFRLSQVELGETVAVIGLGLVGLLAVQICQAAGCSVVGIDLDEDRLGLAERLGVDRTVRLTGESDFSGVESAVSEVTDGLGADAVLVAAATDSDDPVRLAGSISRDKGTVVSIGAVGLGLPRSVYFEKELDFVVSRSYGPGRYDPEYEDKGNDYPVGYVRWTENRNMSAFLGLLADGSVDVQPMITHRIPIEEAQRAYELLRDERPGENPLAIILEYSREERTQGDKLRSSRISVLEDPDPSGAGRERTAGAARVDAPIGVGVLGAGSFALSTLLPVVTSEERVRPIGICASTGASSDHAAKRFGFGYATTSEEEVLSDERVDAVVIATRHDLHARQVQAALESGKHVFCEKPLCLNEDELRAVLTTWTETDEAPRGRPILQVGFNRRFSPMAVKLKEKLRESDAAGLGHYRVNVGHVPDDHWLDDPEVGGGRLVGEGCHFIDLLTFLFDEVPVRVEVAPARAGGGHPQANVAVTLRYADGSLGTLLYTSAGDAALGKERLEMFAGGFAGVLEDYRKLDGYGTDRIRMRHRLRQKKGHEEEWAAFLAALEAGSGWPIPLVDLVGTSLVTFAGVKSLRTGRAVSVDPHGFVDAVLNRSGGEDESGTAVAQPDPGNSGDRP